jgi:hypothetical protein
MIIECPHCVQRIDLGENPPSNFPCPTCHGLIQLKIRAEASTVPVPSSPKQGISLNMLIASIGGAILLTMLASWLIFGRSGNSPPGSNRPLPNSPLPLSERIVGKWENRDDNGMMIYEFGSGGKWQQWIIPIMGDESPDSPELSMFYDNPMTGEFRVEGESLMMRMKISNSLTNPFSDWAKQTISINGDILKITTSGEAGKTLSYKKAKK